MSEDMSNVIKNISNMINSGNIPDNIKDIMNNINLNSNKENSNSNSSQDQSSVDNPFGDIDINMIMKFKSIADAMKNTSNDPRSNLLLSLKPYLKESRKEKVDQYINFLKMASIMGNLNDSGLGNIFGMKNNSSGGNG